MKHDDYNILTQKSSRTIHALYFKITEKVSAKQVRIVSRAIAYSFNDSPSSTLILDVLTTVFVLQAKRAPEII